MCHETLAAPVQPDDHASHDILLSSSPGTDARNDVHVQRMLFESAAASLPDHIFGGGGGPLNFVNILFKALLVQYVNIGVCRCFGTFSLAL